VVYHKGGPLLVLAGAGSGKTRVLTHRIAHLVESRQAGPYEILAITFTNKAAAEMKSRVVELVGPVAASMWVSTFHAACARILRREAGRLDYRSSFTIYDADDQVRLVKHCLDALGYDTKRFPPRGVHARISEAKNRLVDFDEYAQQPERAEETGRGASDASRLLEVTAATYRLYQRRLHELNAMDFDDLIMRTVDVLQLFPDRLAYYRRAFRYILVDEFQDTNRAQYVLVQLLGQEHQQVTVVGDDDQSVYSWRGADVRNILEFFEQDFPGAAVVKLEQNYRSTTTILEAANAVVAHNRGRKPKHLWTDRGQGEPVVVIECRDEHEEARLVAGEIEALLRSGRPGTDIAVFYRVNAQSRVLEDILVRYGVPYRVVGGTRFYERAEIKDLLGYLRALVNPSDDFAFRRIVNVPKRGLGDVAQGRLQLFAAGEGISLREAAARADEITDLSPGARAALSNLAHAFARWTERGGLEVVAEAVGDGSPVGDPATSADAGAVADPPEPAAGGQGPRTSRGAGAPVADQVRAVMEESGLLDAFRNEHTVEAEGRLENLQEFLGVVQEFDRNEPPGSLSDFLEEISLFTDLDTLRDEQAMVTLMTLHNAKGLEFPVVFVVGMEDGVFPHSRALDEQNIEEERRLCYVGLTRAKERLFLSYAQQRSLYGVGSANLPSRFLAEIPSHLMEERRSSSVVGAGSAATRWGRAAETPAPAGPGLHRLDGTSAGRAKRVQATEREVAGFAVGDRVVHAKFGEGLVLGVEAGGVVRVFFGDLGEQKNLLIDYAPLRRL
jgi:DNA helicase II / ATP-dependent DNA helicase PcrA